MSNGSSSTQKEEPLSFFVDFLKKVNQNQWVDLLIGRTISKQDALDRGSSIAVDIATVFENLLPIYRSVLGSGNFFTLLEVFLGEFHKIIEVADSQEVSLLKCKRCTMKNNQEGTTWDLCRTFIKWISPANFLNEVFGYMFGELKHQTASYCCMSDEQETVHRAMRHHHSPGLADI